MFRPAMTIPATKIEEAQAIIDHGVLTETPVMDTHTESALIGCSAQLLREAIAVAAAMGITLDMDIPAIAETNKA